MIVQHFLQWVGTAPEGARAEASGALARAYLHSALLPAERLAAESAMVRMLDDPSPQVRCALAEAVADSDASPPALVLALAGDRPEIAAPVLERSPLLLDIDLVDAVGGGDPALQAAVARRAAIPGPVAAAIAEVGSAEACLILIENPHAMLPAFSLERIVERFGHLSAIREALLTRGGLGAALQQALLVKLSVTLADYAVSQSWMEDHRAQQAAREACERATVAMAARMPGAELQPLVRHLRASGQLTAGFLLRTLLSGNILLFEEALAELTELPAARVSGLLHERSGKGLRPLFARAGMPESLFPALRAAIETIHEGEGEDADEASHVAGQLAGAARLRRRMVERVLTCCEEAVRSFETEPLLVLLRRFALEAMRDEARQANRQLAA